VLVALTLLEVVLLGAFTLLHRAAAEAARATLVERATWEATAMAGLVDPASEGEVPLPWGRLRWAGGLLSAEDSAGVVLVRLQLASP